VPRGSKNAVFLHPFGGIEIALSHIEPERYVRIASQRRWRQTVKQADFFSAPLARMLSAAHQRRLWFSWVNTLFGQIDGQSVRNRRAAVRLRRCALGVSLLTILLASRASFPDEAGTRSEWSEVARISAGEKTWVTTRDQAMTEYVMVHATEEGIRLALLSSYEMGASRKDVTAFCDGDVEGRLAVDGKLVPYSRLCRVVLRSEVREVYVRRRSSPLEAILVGALVGGGAMLIPCQAAPQADGSAAGCALSSMGVGALVGWGVHGMRRGKLVRIYAVAAPEK
jgi:hypothetical protein